MEAFVIFFEELSSGQKVLWVFFCMTIFWLLEGIYPMASFKYKKWKHARVNLVLLSTTFLINFLFGLATAGIFIWIGENQFGLLHLIDLPIWMELILGIMFLDFMAQYVVHYLLHKVSFMWRFHMVHHSDTHVDVTTGTRHHPGDYMFREIFSLFAILIFGMPVGFYLVYRVLSILFTYFSHANFQLPSFIDKVVSYVFITPKAHKFHHHFERPWTDTNFGNIFSFWDRIFGTYVYENTDDIQYGLDVLEDKYSNDLAYQLKVPFNKDIKTDY